jgi:GTP-binding protein
VIIAKGGRGGLGNTCFKTSTNRSPRKTTNGTLGEEFDIWLELKIIADVGLVGFPNSGKSSFLSRATKAKPKIADYPFTTLNPSLGVFSAGDKEIVIADIPGLIEGAHEGVGLGDKFLKHIERCKSIIHLIDITEENLFERYTIIRNELKNYSKKLLDKKEIVAFNKIDMIDDKEKEKKTSDFRKKYKKKFYEISVIKNQNIQQLLYSLL